MESDNFYTSCVHKSDCLMVKSADVKVFVFLSKHEQDRNATLSAEVYYSTCSKDIKKVLKNNAGDNPATIWPKIEKVCPRILHFYRHIFFGTGFKAEGLMKIGWSYAGWNTYQHIHKYYERGQSVTGQEYHLFMMMQ
uniref:PiggyBac transposable element-derived protein domain-containing protein n=1 Tax=Panagrolaimus sp. PS1159 TaxID=55785 RepID=A0AC35FSS9_9BILA